MGTKTWIRPMALLGIATWSLLWGLAGGFLAGRASMEGRLADYRDETALAVAYARQMEALVKTMENANAEEAYYRGVYDICYTSFVKGYGQDYTVKFCLQEIADRVMTDWYGTVSPGWDWQTALKLAGSSR